MHIIRFLADSLTGFRVAGLGRKCQVIHEANKCPGPGVGEKPKLRGFSGSTVRCGTHASPQRNATRRNAKHHTTANHTTSDWFRIKLVAFPLINY